MPMPVRFPDGAVVEFPDGTPKEAIDQHYQQNYGGRSPVVTNLANAATLASRFLQRPQQEVSTMPSLAGTNFAFGNQAGVNAVMQSQQQSNQDSMRAKLERERMAQQELDAEKSRANQIKLEQLRHRNEKSELEFKMQKDLAIAKNREATGSAIYDEETKQWMQPHKSAETGEMYFVPISGPQPKKDNSKTTYDAMRGAVVNYGGGGPPSAMSIQGLPERQEPAVSDAARISAINARAKFFAGYGRPDGKGGVTPLSPTEATALAQAEYDDQPASEGVVDYSGLVPVPKTNQRPFTWRDITAEMARRRQAYGILKSEAEIASDVAGDFGMSVEELRGIMSQRSVGGMPVVQGLQPDVPAAAATPAQPQPKVVVERRRNPTTGKVMVKYNDGTTGYE